MVNEVETFFGIEVFDATFLFFLTPLFSKVAKVAKVAKVEKCLMKKIKNNKKYNN
jgi:hypothetical protein